MSGKVLVVITVLAIGSGMSQDDGERNSPGELVVPYQPVPGQLVQQGELPTVQLLVPQTGEQLLGEHLKPHKDYVHNIPPPPEPSLNSYIATLSYGEGYATIIYHCSVTSVTPEDANAVKGPGGYICTVSYHKTFSHPHHTHAVQGNQPSKPTDPISTLLDIILPTPEKTPISA